MKKPLRIALDCRIADAQQGIGTAVLALTRALSKSAIADQEYTVIVRSDMADWLRPHVFGPCRLVEIPVKRRNALLSTMVRMPPLRFIGRKLLRKSRAVPVSDGYVESQGFDLVHFPTQMAYLTDLPSIYQPWDLQHLHYPLFFSAEARNARETLYRAFCQRAAWVCVQAQWTRSDLIAHYGLSPDKVAVVPWGSVFDAYTSPSKESRRATIAKYRLPKRFFFYPAATWPHKNHETILRAMALLKTSGHEVPDVYFTGALTVHQQVLERLARTLQVHEQVHFLGFLTSDELQSIYESATAMIFASKFEGFGLPILEAFHAKLPVLSSNATTLPEVAQDAALYFDPASPEELASLMRRVLEDGALRQELIDKGTSVLTRSSMADTARNFQTLYRRTVVSSSKERYTSLTATGRME